MSTEAAYSLVYALNFTHLFSLPAFSNLSLLVWIFEGAEKVKRKGESRYFTGRFGSQGVPAILIPLPPFLQD